MSHALLLGQVRQGAGLAAHQNHRYWAEAGIWWGGKHLTRARRALLV